MTPQTQTQTAHKIIRALWYAWQLPELHRHQATLEQCDGAARAAYEAIEGGAATLARAALTPGPARDLLDLVYQFEPPAELRAKLKNLTKEQGLAGDLWPDRTPVMVASFSHFSGSYPEAKRVVTCKVRGEFDYDSMTLRARPHTLWRGYTTKDGAVIDPCPHCQHERILDFCHKIETASELYMGANMLRFVELPEGEVETIAARLRKRRKDANSRYENSQDWREKDKAWHELNSTNYTTFPLDNGKTILLHDADDVGGRELPENRAALYEWVKSWAFRTPKGKRAGRGLATWGKRVIKHAPKSCKPSYQDWKQTAGEDEKSESAEPTEEKPKRCRLIFDSYLTAMTRLCAYFHLETDPKRVKFPPELRPDILTACEELGIDYAVDGELPDDVTHKIVKTKKYYVMRDMAESGGADLQPGSPPKPINLPGVGVIL